MRLALSVIFVLMLVPSVFAVGGFDLEDCKLDSNNYSCDSTVTISCDVLHELDGSPTRAVSSVSFQVGSSSNSVTLVAELTSGNNSFGTWTATFETSENTPSDFELLSVYAVDNYGSYCRVSNTCIGEGCEDGTTETDFCSATFGVSEATVDCDCSYSSFEGICQADNTKTVTRTPSLGCGVDASSYSVTVACDRCQPDWYASELVCFLDSYSSMVGSATATFTDANACCQVTGLTEDCQKPVLSGQSAVCVQDQYDAGGSSNRNTHEGSSQSYFNDFITNIVSSATSTRSTGDNYKPVVLDFDGDGVTEIAVFEGANLNFYTPEGLLDSVISTDYDYLVGNPEALFFSTSDVEYGEYVTNATFKGGIAFLGFNSSNNGVYFNSYTSFGQVWTKQQSIYLSSDIGALTCEERNCFTVNSNKLYKIHPISGVMQYVADPTGVSTLSGTENNKPVKLLDSGFELTEEDDVWGFRVQTFAGFIGLAYCGSSSCSVYNPSLGAVYAQNFSAPVVIQTADDDLVAVGHTYYYQEGANTQARLIVNVVDVSDPSSPTIDNTFIKVYQVAGTNTTCVSQPSAAICDGGQPGFVVATAYEPIEEEATFQVDAASDINSYSDLQWDAVAQPAAQWNNVPAGSNTVNLEDDPAMTVCGKGICAGVTHQPYDNYNISNVQDLYLYNGDSWSSVAWPSSMFDDTKDAGNGYRSLKAKRVVRTVLTVGILDDENLIVITGLPHDNGVGANAGLPQNLLVKDQLEVWFYNYVEGTWFFSTLQYPSSYTAVSAGADDSSYQSPFLGAPFPMGCYLGSCKFFGGIHTTLYDEASWVGEVTDQGSVSWFYPSSSGLRDRDIVDHYRLGSTHYVVTSESGADGDPDYKKTMRVWRDSGSSSTIVRNAASGTTIVGLVSGGSNVVWAEVAGWPSGACVADAASPAIIGANEIFDSSYQDIEFTSVFTPGADYKCNVTIYTDNSINPRVTANTFRFRESPGTPSDAFYVVPKVIGGGTYSSGTNYVIVPVRYTAQGTNEISVGVLDMKGNLFFPFLATYSVGLRDTATLSYCDTFNSAENCVPISHEQLSDYQDQTSGTSILGTYVGRTMPAFSNVQHSDFTNVAFETKNGIIPIFKRVFDTVIETVSTSASHRVECSAIQPISGSFALVDASMVSLSGNVCFDNLFTFDATGNGVDEVLTPDGVLVTSINGYIKEVTGISDLAVPVAVDYSSDKRFDLLFVTGTSLKTLTSKSDLVFSRSESALNVSKVECSFNPSTNVISASVSGLSAPNLEGYSGVFNLYTDGVFLKTSGYLGKVLSTDFKLSRSGEVVVEYVLSYPGEESVSNYCVSNLVVTVEENETEDNIREGLCSLGLGGEFNYLESPLEYGWDSQKGSFTMTGSQYSPSGDGYLSAEIDCDASYLVAETKFSVSNRGAIAFTLIDEQEFIRSTILIEDGKLYVDDWSSDAYVSAGFVAGTSYILKVTQDSDLQTYDVVIMDNSDQIIYSDAHSIPNINLQSGKVFGSFIINNYVGKNYVDYVRLLGAGEFISSEQTGEERDLDFLKNCVSPSKRDFDEVPPGYLNLNETERRQVYRNVQLYCASSSDDGQCGFTQLASVVRKNPDCWSEAYLYCLDVTYRSDPDADDYKDDLEQYNLKAGLDGATVCGTVLSTSSGVEAILAPIFNSFWRVIRHNWLLSILSVFILVIAVVVYAKRR